MTLLFKLYIFLLRYIILLIPNSHDGNKQISKLGIIAGLKGWDLIDVIETYNTAVEYFGEKNVIKIVIKNNFKSDLFFYLRKKELTHIFYDPRVGEQNIFKSIIESTIVLFLFKYYNVIPIVWLTDVPVKTWRYKSNIVTLNNGIILTLMKPMDIYHLFFHKRIIGPLMMPISNKTFNWLNSKQDNRNLNTVAFFGSLYEPRTTKIKLYESKLKEYSINLIQQTRSLTDTKITNEDYWIRMLSVNLLFTTSDQIINIKNVENFELGHLIYRYTEALACGCILLAPIVNGVDIYFEPNKDFIVWDNIDNAVSQTVKLLQDPLKYKHISINAKNKISYLIKTNFFWNNINFSLNVDGFIKNQDKSCIY